MSISKKEAAMLLIEHFSKKQKDGFFPCPRCGRMDMDEKPTRNALSRRVNVYICDFCGTDEAVEDFIGAKITAEEWAIVKRPELFQMETEG